MSEQKLDGAEELGIPETSGRLTFEDLCQICEQSLGLRHVSSRQVAEAQEKQGFYGDGLAIASVAKLIAEEELTEPRLRLLPLRRIAGLLSEESKKVLIGRFSQKLKEFFYESVGIDLGKIAGPKDNWANIQSKLENGPSFMVARFQNADSGYDEHNYYGIGKAGKQRVKPEQIKFMFGVESSDLPPNFAQAEEIFTTERFKSLGRHISERLFEKFSEKLHTSGK